MSPAPVLDANARELLDRSRVARLATADRRSRPHVIPFCYARLEDRLYFVVDEKPKAAGKTLKRLRNIAENPQVALVVDVWDEDWARLEYLLVRGRAAVVGDAGEAAVALEALRARYPQYRTMALEVGRNAVVRIDAEAAHHWRGARADHRPIDSPPRGRGRREASGEGAAPSKHRARESPLTRPSAGLSPAGRGKK